MNILNLTEALSFVPTHYPLPPGKFRFEPGDQINEYGWNEMSEESDGVREGRIITEFGVMRPIPERVRHSAAWRIYYDHLATVDAREDGWLFYLFPDFDPEWGVCTAGVGFRHIGENYGIRKFATEDDARRAEALLEVKIEPGKSRVIEELSLGPDPIGRWAIAMYEKELNRKIQ